jgi:hypothetical protein
MIERLLLLRPSIEEVYSASRAILDDHDWNILIDSIQFLKQFKNIMSLASGENVTSFVIMPYYISLKETIKNIQTSDINKEIFTNYKIQIIHYLDKYLKKYLLNKNIIVTMILDPRYTYLFLRIETSDYK